MNCIFCKIVDGEVSSYKIYEDDCVIAFLDINPDTLGHTLIIPKKHYTDLEQIDSEIFNKVLEVAQLLKKRLEMKLNCDGLTLVQNNGFVQEVKHFHIHLKPQYIKKRSQPIDQVYSLLK